MSQTNSNLVKNQFKDTCLFNHLLAGSQSYFGNVDLKEKTNKQSCTKQADKTKNVFHKLNQIDYLKKCTRDSKAHEYHYMLLQPSASASN